MSVQVRPAERDEVAWLESEFNTRWPWPRASGFVADVFDQHSFLVATDENGGYLGHCHVRQSRYEGFRSRGIPEIADLNVMPESRRRGAATALLDYAEDLIAATTPIAGIGVGLYDDYGPAQRLYTGRGYVLDGTGAWAGTENVRGGAVLRFDDDLVLYLTKPVRRPDR